MFWLEAIVERNKPNPKHDGTHQENSMICSFPNCKCDFQNNGRHLCPKQEPQK